MLRGFLSALPICKEELKPADSASATGDDAASRMLSSIRKAKYSALGRRDLQGLKGKQQKQTRELQ